MSAFIKRSQIKRGGSGTRRDEIPQIPFCSASVDRHRFDEVSRCSISTQCYNHPSHPSHASQLPTLRSWFDTCFSSTHYFTSSKRTLTPSKASESPNNQDDQSPKSDPTSTQSFLSKILADKRLEVRMLHLWPSPPQPPTPPFEQHLTQLPRLLKSTRQVRLCFILLPSRLFVPSSSLPFFQYLSRHL
jgi:hypothetical protein